MSALTALVLAVPAPSPSPVVESTSGGSPGFIGFVVTFALALAAAGLFLSLTRHLRRVDRRAQQLGVDDEHAADSSAADQSDERGSGEQGSDEQGSDEHGPGEVVSDARGSGERGGAAPAADGPAR
ncbi:hypothetical protein [Cellulomonas sp. A375-1]|uniref:hypothetical protein n=1 Tax=Cellulomonas sp. A375-1 TaxID=1672219 RepID=UPI00069DD35A|nr:hypothetical protein [Cellulomonas sp. A375-1]